MYVSLHHQVKVSTSNLKFEEEENLVVGLKLFSGFREASRICQLKIRK